MKKNVVWVPNLSFRKMCFNIFQGRERFRLNVHQFLYNNHINWYLSLDYNLTFKKFPTGVGKILNWLYLRLCLLKCFSWKNEADDSHKRWYTFFTGNSIFHLSLESLKKFWKILKNNSEQWKVAVFKEKVQYLRLGSC